MIQCKKTQGVGRKIGALVFVLVIDMVCGKMGSISKRPTQLVNKAKIMMMQDYTIAKYRNNTGHTNVTGIPRNETGGSPDEPPGEWVAIVPENQACRVGVLKQGKCWTHPLITTYMEQPTATTAEETVVYDVYVAVSYDEGSTWKRINLSKSAGRKSTYTGRRCYTDKDTEDEGGDDHTHEDSGGGGGPDGGDHGDDGTTFEFAVDTFKPMIAVKQSYALIAWLSQDCKGGIGNEETPQHGKNGTGDGKNETAVTGDGTNETGTADGTNETGTDDGTNETDHGHHGGNGTGLPYYTLDGSISTDPPDNNDKWLIRGSQCCHEYGGDIGIRAFQCVWTVRGILDKTIGEIVFTKSERHTSGRRDAAQLFISVNKGSAAKGNKNGGFALVWQEDPRGIKTGEGYGPGDGFTGATVNHKTDLWYSYLPFSNFSNTKELNDTNVPLATDRFTPAVRLTSNTACKYNMSAPDDRKTRGPPFCIELCENTIFTDELYDSEKQLYTCLGKDGKLMKGNVGASRATMMMVADEGEIARTLIVYEQSKGLGHQGDPGSDKDDLGKNVFYTQFIFDAPKTLHSGTRVNDAELDDHGNVVISTNGQECTQNARRPRLVTLPKANVGEQGVHGLILYRMGEEGHGKPADIFLRRLVGGYSEENLECQGSGWYNNRRLGRKVCTKGSININEDQEAFNSTSRKDSRAHRGFIQGDRVVLLYIMTTRWGRYYGMPYNVYIRRSFDGGKSFTDRQGKKEAAVNLSNLRNGTPDGNSGFSTMEPRLVPTPGTIKNGAWSKSDTQNPLVFFVSYCTTQNPHQGGGTGTSNRFLGDANLPETKDVPKDIYLTWTNNFGESYHKTWNPQANKTQYPFLAKTKGPANLAQVLSYGQPQIKPTPAGDKVFASFVGNVIKGLGTGGGEGDGEGNGDGDGGGGGGGGGGGDGDGGGPCHGSSKILHTSDVCSNSTVGLDHFGMYDLNQDGMVTHADLEELSKQFMFLGDDAQSADFDGDGKVSGSDVQLLKDAIEAFKPLLPNGGRYLRGR